MLKVKSYEYSSELFGIRVYEVYKEVLRTINKDRFISS